uniref:Secreted protein n=1 Tax=Amphimedon queenslandica TaxID=400682 RepID=A0A1X7VRL9_AMPQE
MRNRAKTPLRLLLLLVICFEHEILQIGVAFEANSLVIPHPFQLSNDTSGHPLQFVIVGEEPVPLKSVLRPFSGGYLPVKKTWLI